MAWSFGKDPITGFLNVAGSAIADVGYNTFTGSWGKGNEFSQTSNAWNTYMNPNQKKSSSGGGGSTPTPSPSPSGSGSKASSDWARESAALTAQLNALTAQMAAQPKLPNFDILANYNKAKQTATSAVTPLYNKKLNLFLEGQGIKKDTKTKETNLAKENNQIALNNALEDNSTSRTRTGEDLANVLASIGTQRENFLEDDAAQFDVARRALMEETAAGGATDTGLGQKAIQTQQDQRNEMAARQTEEFQNQEAAKRMLATRTIDDLAVSDTRNKQKKTQDDKAVQIDFDGYMKSLANEEKSFRLTNELEQALAIAEQTRTYQQEGVNQFIAGLAGQGWRAQDIALAKQVYG
jgi:hypothetical protein